MSADVILVVDDSPDTRDLTCMVLQVEGIASCSAESGAEALALLASGLRPNLILLDQFMPGMNGLEVVAELARDPELAAIPVVLVTGLAMDTLPQGVMRVLTKPYQFDQLVAAARACGTA